MCKPAAVDEAPAVSQNVRLLRLLTCLMFFCFAMTTDAVGSVIPQLIEEYGLSLKAAGAFHYAPMSAIALGALLLGFLADRMGRQRTILLGLGLYAASSFAFAFTDSFTVFVGLLVLSGLGVGLFKVGALALIGDISSSPSQHTSNMNLAEGFFAVGSIAGPAVVALLLATGISWKWLYVMAAALCGVLIVVAGLAKYPPTPGRLQGTANLRHTLALARSPYALGFSGLIMLYVATEVAIYVWMPTYLHGYHGRVQHLVPYALTAFFVLRAAGRFVGIWTLQHFSWSAVLALFSFAIFACFAASLLGGPSTGVFLLPLSGLFMSVIYPTLNSKGISCFERLEHGGIAGIILFFTAAAAAGAPFVMAAASDFYGNPSYGFAVAAVFALLLFVGLLINLLLQPTEQRLGMLRSP